MSLPKLSLKDWQNRWNVFGNDGCGFIWYGVDSIGNLAEFCCEEAFIPEIVFQDFQVNKQLNEYFEKLPKITNSLIPTNLRNKLKEIAERNLNWGKESERGIYIFDEPCDADWYEQRQFTQFAFTKNPYELCSVPEKSLNVTELPFEIQNSLKPFNFDNLRFSDCQFLDVSKYFYCEK